MGFEDLLNLTVKIQRPVVTQSRSHRTRRTYNDIATGIAAGIQRGRGRLVMTDAGQVLQATWLGFFLPDQDVVESDRVVVTAGDQPALPDTFEVMTVENLRGHHLEAELRTVNVE